MEKLIVLTLVNNATVEYTVPAEKLDDELAHLDTVLTNPAAMHISECADCGDQTVIPSRNILYYTVIGADLVDADEYAECVGLCDRDEDETDDKDSITVQVSGAGLSADEVEQAVIKALCELLQQGETD